MAVGRSEASTMSGAGRLLSPAQIGRVNRSRVLELLLQHGPTSRAQLARLLGVNRATVATILLPLIDDETLVEGEALAPTSAGGKPARPVWFNDQGPELGAVRISSRRVIAARLGLDGSIRQQVEKMPPKGGWSSRSVRSALLAAAGSCFEGRALFGIGVAAAGMVDSTAGVILSLHLAPALNGLDVQRLFAERFGAPVWLDHHPRVLAMGDRWFGLGRGLDTFASVYTGEALGLGLVVGGRVMRGLHGAGGEYGHTVVDLSGEECMCGRRGCWETVATVRWLRGEAAHLGLPGAEHLDSARLATLAANGDEAARSLMDRYAGNLAIGLANNEHALASHTYIVHGDAAGGGEAMRRLLEQHLQAASPARDRLPRVWFDGTDEDPLLRGCGGLVLSAEIAPGR